METQQLAGAGIGEWDILLQFIMGVAGVLVGYAVAQKIKKAENKNELTLNVILAMWFSGTVTIIVEIAEFFIDFYKGTNILHTDFVSDDHWFYRIFGMGMSPEAQRPLFDTDEDFIMALLGAFVMTGALYIYQRIKNKAMFIKEKAEKTKLSFGEKVRNKIETEKIKLERDCSIADILFWWCTRALMLYAFIVMDVRAEANLLLANLIATFTITLIHLIFPEGTFFSKISYRTQSLITVIVFFGSYCGNYVWLYGIVSRFDLFLHLISGALCVFGGYYIALTLVKADSKKNVLIISLFAFAFSCFIMPAWEVSEFIGDFIWGTSNQGFYWGPSDSSFFFKVFGRGIGNTRLYYLFDTFYDVLLAASTTVPSAIALYAYLRMNLKKNGGTAVVSEKKKTTVTC